MTLLLGASSAQPADRAATVVTLALAGSPAAEGAACAAAWEGRMEGDAAFASFVREQTGALVRSAYLLTGSVADAEDLVQETLLRLYPKWDRVMSADAPIAYVRRSLVNSFLNNRRKPSSREVTFAELPERWDERDIGRDLTDRDQVWRLLTVLPDRQRAALVLRFFHDLPDDEIARALGCRLGTVRSLVSRGLAALRERLASEAAAEHGAGGSR